MDVLSRLIGFGASLAGTVGQLGVIAVTAPAAPECGWSLCWHGGHPGPVTVFVGWEPYIDNPGVGVQPSRERRCPGGQAAGSSYRLDYAPLPAGFDPHGYPGGDIIACVKLGADGSVEAVRIFAGTGRPRIDSLLLRSIHRQWRFRPVEGAGAGQAWQRVRLSSRYGTEPVISVQWLPL
ncbi:MAG TPA: hypothetical protein VF759_13390 [Allosphingosinicella sp.]|jgi:hypothetical protein